MKIVRYKSGVSYKYWEQSPIRTDDERGNSKNRPSGWRREGKGFLIEESEDKKHVEERMGTLYILMKLELKIKFPINLNIIEILK